MPTVVVMKSVCERQYRPKGGLSLLNMVEGVVEGVVGCGSVRDVSEAIFPPVSLVYEKTVAAVDSPIRSRGGI